MLYPGPQPWDQQTDRHNIVCAKLTTSLPHDCVDCGHSPSLIVPVSQVPGNYSYTLKDTDNPRSRPQISQMLRVFRMAVIKKNLQTVHAGEGVEKRESFYTDCGNVNWYSHFGKLYGGSLKRLKTEPPYDPAIPLLGIYSEKTIIQKDTCSPMFVAALFTIAKTWKQPNGLSTKGWIKKMWYIYTTQ